MLRSTLKEEISLCERLDQLNITMFGKRIHNPAGKKRTSYDIHPYSKQGTGVSCTITYTDPKTNKIYVLLAKKRNKNQYDQIGGYTRGQGPEGSELNFDKRSEDERDRDEEELIGNVDAVNLEENTSLAIEPANTTYSLSQLKELSRKGFQEQQSQKLGKKINPLLMKELFFKSGLVYNNDYNALDTALREIKEETGLDLSNLKPKELYTSDDFGISNEDERLHTKTTHYLFHLGTLLDEAPPIKAGSDIETLKWVPITDIDLKNGVVKNDLPIRQSYLLQTLPRAIKRVRELELAEVTNNIFTKYKSLHAHVFTNPYSEEAAKHHQAVLKKAERISKLIQPEINEEISLRNK